MAKVGMLLPHEIIAALFQHRSADTNLFSNAGLDGVGHRHLLHACHVIGSSIEETIALRVWVDGVCTKWDRSGSHDMLVMSLPGLHRRFANMRMPLLTMDHCWVAQGETWDCILNIMTWSLRIATRGQVAPNQA